MTIVQALLIFFVPGLSIWLASRVKLIEWLGPVVLCYIVGITMANLPWVVHKGLVKNVTELTIVLALPLLLFSADVKAWLKVAPKTLLSFGLMLVAAVSSALLTYLFMGANVKDGAKIAGMLVGMYSGGTANTNAIGTALGVEHKIFVLVTSADLMIGGVYLLFVLSIGQRVLLRFLPKYQAPEVTEEAPVAEVAEEAEATKEGPFASLPKLAQLGVAFGLCLAVVGSSVGISMLIYGKIEATPVILMLTTFGLIASLWRPVRALAWSYEAGDYLLLMFCVAIGAMVDIQKMLQSKELLTFLGFAACLMVGAILIHFALSALFRIDADTTLITSAAGIFGPPFIGPIASALKNKQLLVSGLTMSIAGLAVGTYLGVILAKLLM